MKPLRATHDSHQLKRWKRSFRARLPSNSKRRRSENEASCEASFKVKEVKTKLSCEASFKFQKFKKWTHLTNAAVPINKVLQRMQNTKAQHHQGREKVTWNHQFHCARNSSKILRQTNDARNRRASEPTFLRNRSSVYPEKRNVSCKSQHSNRTDASWKRSFRARLPSNSKNWKVENEAFVRGFLQIPKVQEVNASHQCSSSNAQSMSTHAKHKSTASSKRRTSHQEPSVPLRAQFEQDFTANQRRPQPSRKRAYFSPQQKLRLPEKTQCFVQILTFKSHRCFMKTKLSCEASFKFQENWKVENEAFVRGFLRIPTVECMRTKLSCEDSFKADSTQLQSTRRLNST